MGAWANRVSVEDFAPKDDWEFSSGTPAHSTGLFHSSKGVTSFVAKRVDEGSGDVVVLELVPRGEHPERSLSCKRE